VLFGEDGARVVVTCRADVGGRVEALARRHSVPLFNAGIVGPAGGMLEITMGDRTLAWNGETLRRTYFDAIPRRMRRQSATGTGSN
jgi:hypothetical protein